VKPPLSIQPLRKACGSKAPSAVSGAQRHKPLDTCYMWVNRSTIDNISGMSHPCAVRRNGPDGRQGDLPSEEHSRARVPALEPVAMFTVEFSTPDEKKNLSSKETRMVAARDEIEVVNAVHRYFAVEQILSVSRQGYVYVTPTAMRQACA
jgi:hypothetical protein